MKTINLNGVSAKHKIIVVLANCAKGAAEAGRFAVRNLFDKNSKIVLLQTYQKPKYGHTMLRNLSGMLNNIALEDLRGIENILVKEFNLSSESFIKMACEDDLKSILKNEFSKFPNVSLVIGNKSIESKKNFPCRKIINSAIESDIRPVVVVNDSVTLIEKDTMVVYSESDKKVDSDYLSFLKEIKLKNSMRMTMHTSAKLGKFIPSTETTSHFRKINGTIYEGISEGELLLRKELKNIINRQTNTK